jgi:hypothetical protein
VIDDDDCGAFSGMRIGRDLPHKSYKIRPGNEPGPPKWGVAMWSSWTHHLLAELELRIKWQNVLMSLNFMEFLKKRAMFYLLLSRKMQFFSNLQTMYSS